MSDSATPICDKCGIECTTGMMAAYCSKGRECEFWPHSDGTPDSDGAELLMHRFWMGNTLEQIALQIEDRKLLDGELATCRHAIPDTPGFDFLVGKTLPERVKALVDSFSKWIPVSERPCPLDDGTYLVTDGKNVAPLVRGLVNNNVGTRWDWDFGAQVTHWMPLPEAPQ